MLSERQATRRPGLTAPPTAPGSTPWQHRSSCRPRLLNRARWPDPPRPELLAHGHAPEGRRAAGQLLAHQRARLPPPAGHGQFRH
eukprot:2102411-Pyramimonas_sp.AAC.1